MTTVYQYLRGAVIKYWQNKKRGAFGVNSRGIIGNAKVKFGGNNINIRLMPITKPPAHSMETYMGEREEKRRGRDPKEERREGLKE